MQPIIHLTPPSLPGSIAGKFAMMSAALGGLAVLVCVTVFAILLSAGAFSRANSHVDVEPKTQPKAVEGDAKE